MLLVGFENRFHRGRSGRRRLDRFFTGSMRERAERIQCLLAIGFHRSDGIKRFIPENRACSGPRLETGSPKCAFTAKVVWVGSS
ncbi:MAG: hypothetical protein GEU73_13070 [Chloroflexi bacterium]|nr:hypothetical protein [Chloroflexota bacterium]